MKIVNFFKKIPNFFSEVRQELKKVSWSTREELFGATWVVITLTLVLAVFIGVIDFGLSKLLVVVLK